MTVYFADDSVTLHLGHASAVLRELPAGSVHCCVTSPPYFGLRDYGTAQWVGGDPDCGHGVRRWDGPKQTQGAQSGHAARSDRLDRDGCGECGAARVDEQVGLEASPAEYVATLRELFAEVRRVLTDDGTLWLNLGDSYSGGGGGGGGKHAAIGGYTSGRNSSEHYQRMGLGPKNLLGMPWRVAFALQEDGWILRKDIIWHKVNAMPESVTDRPSTKKEYLFLFCKRPEYWFDLDPIREPAATADRPGPRRSYPPGSASSMQADEHTAMDGPFAGLPLNPLGRNPGDVWAIPSQPFGEAHFAVMPTALAERCVQAGCRPGGVVLDPFSGSGTTGLAAARHGRRYVGIDLNREYLDLSLRTRLAQPGLDFTVDSSQPPGVRSVAGG